MSRSSGEWLVWFWILLVIALFAVGCADEVEPTVTTLSASSVPSTTSNPAVVFCTEPLPGEVMLADTSTLVDPASDGENWPTTGTYTPFDDRDGPQSDYAPCFVNAPDADYEADTVVIGVSIDGEARAFARAQLIARPVNDHIGVTPLLVAY